MKLLWAIGTRKLESRKMNEQFDIIIEPDKGMTQYWKDLWRYRGLFYFLAWRDILVRYKQTVIGIASESFGSFRK